MNVCFYTLHAYIFFYNYDKLILTNDNHKNNKQKERKKNTQLILETIDESNRNGRNYIQMANNSN